MILQLQFLVFVVLPLKATLGTLTAADSACSVNLPINNTDFTITCTKSQGTQVTVSCKTPQPWSNFPRNKLNQQHIDALVFHNCSFPRGLSLLNVTTSLGLDRISSLKFEESPELPSGEHLQGVSISSLEITGSSVSELPKNLLHEIGIEKLHISKTEFRSIPEGFFEKSAGLTYLNISDCKLVRLKRDDLAPLRNLTTLSLFRNELEEIEPGSFDSLVSLRFLEVRYNRLRTMPTRVFRSLVMLDTINLNHNEFTELPVDLLHIENSALHTFKLNYNKGKLATLPGGFFKNLGKLSYIELIGNNFTSLPADLFEGLHLALRTLIIRNNSLTSLPAKIFENTSNLNELNLSQNKLESLPDRVFQSANLEKLFMDDNRLTNLSLGVLAGLNNLRSLSVSHNKLVRIDENAYKYLNKVEYVDVSHNQLTLEHPTMKGFSSLTNCSLIVELNVSYNKISQLFDDVYFAGNIKTLNMEGNEITYLKDEYFERLQSDLELNFRKNKISTIDLSGLEQLAGKIEKPENIKVYVEDNPLNCDCNNLHFIRYLEKNLSSEVYSYLNIYTGNLKCAAPSEFKNFDVTNVHSEELKCLVKPNVTNDICSETCTCWDYPGRKALSVDCSYRNLTRVPQYIENPHNWSIDLNLSGNRLLETPALNNSYLLNVSTLDLSSNNISRVTVDVFSKSLQNLKLHNNSISRLDAKVVEYLAEDKSLRNLTLHKNQWICDCEARDFLSVAQKKLTASELYKVMCRGTNRRLSAMTANELCESKVAIIVIVSLLIAFFGVILGGLVALYYRYQKEIKVWLYSKQWCMWFVTEDELDKDKQYDAFISFSHKDEDFVDKEIVAKLEDGSKPYKLCLHYRDWLAGEWIPAQIARSVDESRRTIVVLSPNFLESIWGRMEFRTAHSQALSEGRARVIVILYGDIGDTEDLDPELKAYLSMNTYVKWGDPWFWDKLRYALPHRYETTKRRTRHARLIENHLAQLSANKNDSSCKNETIPLPRITASANDSEKLLAPQNSQDESTVAAC